MPWNTDDTRYSYRLPQAEDLPAILRVQQESYPASMQEERQTVLARIAAARESCRVADDGRGVCAYLFAYPSLLGKVTPLGGSFAVAAQADTLYLHDLAVSQRAAGQGLGAALVESALAAPTRAGCRYSALVSVQESRRFWERLGYRVREALDETQTEILRTYPDTSWYMVKSIAD